MAWLAAVLASRGMPRWLLETHLCVLCDELSAAAPARAADYSKLRSAAQILCEERQAWIAQAVFDALVAAFESAAGRGLKGTGGLLVAAVCDECCGLPEAVPSLMGWLGDLDRFSPQWCAAVADTLAGCSPSAEERPGVTLALNASPAIDEASYPHYLELLLAGDRHRCSDLVQEQLRQGVVLKADYLDLIQRAMYEVGTLWEKTRSRS